jgi:hypothetical protein
MSILKKIVIHDDVVKDYRGTAKSYYEAQCDQCGRIYYPNRNTSRYCSRTCQIQAYNGNALHKNEPVVAEVEVKPVKKLTSRKEASLKAAELLKKIKNRDLNRSKKGL